MNTITFITLDGENRLVGYRSGHYNLSEQQPTEILYTSDTPLDFGTHMFSVYNQSTNTFTKDDRAVSLLNAMVSLSPKLIGTVEFKNKFTIPEKSALFSQRAADPIIDDFLKMLDDARINTIDLKSQNIEEILNYLVSKNIITASRKDDIINK